MPQQTRTRLRRRITLKLQSTLLIEKVIQLRTSGMANTDRRRTTTNNAQTTIVFVPSTIVSERRSVVT